MKALKTFVLWLLLSVLPLQGIAVNAILTCAAANEGSVQLQSHDGQAHSQHGTMHQSGDDGDSPDRLKSADRSCSAYCGGALWMHVEAISLPAIPVASAHISYLDFHILSVVPEGPEHRPRFLSA